MLSKRRPRLVTCLSASVLIFSAVQVAGFWGGFMLPDLPLTVPKTYLLFKNGLWALAGLTLALGLFTGKTWALKTVRWAALGLGVWYWLDRVFFTRSDFARGSWPMAVLVTCVILMGLIWITGRQSVRDYYWESKL